MPTTPRDLEQQADNLYERYGKALESDHWGSFVAISADGRTVIAKTLLEVAQQAEASLGRGVFVFRIGERLVGNWR